MPGLRSLGARLISFSLASSAVAVLLVDAAALPLALPLLVTANLFVLYVAVLRARDGELPVCELGSVCVLITALYGSVPVLGYWLGGLQWSPFSDQRLYASHMTPVDVAAVGWRYVVYLASFIAAYLAWRGRPAARAPSLPAVDARIESAAILAILGFSTFFLLVFVRYGTSEDVGYATSAVGAIPSWAQLPPLLYFGARAGVAILLVAKLCLLVMLFQRWAQLRYRVVVLAWLALEVVHAVERMGVRRDVAMLLMAAALLYHRLVRPLAVWQAATTVTALLAGLLVFGFVRQGWGLSVPWSANNEFQVLFANAWDLLGRREHLHVPWQIYASDLLRLIPPDVQGSLPFDVLDPSLWYLRVIDVRDPRVGLMFGVLAQSVIGWDWMELALRGAALGVVCAAIHRWYARSTGFWPTVLYLYLCVWAYYTVRATTFHVVSLVFWRFLPSLLVLVPAAWLIGRLQVSGWPRLPQYAFVARAVASVWATIAAGWMPAAKVVPSESGFKELASRTAQAPPAAKKAHSALR